MRNLSINELIHINTHKTCPDCKIGEFLEGPRALQINVNVKCNHEPCHREFCLTIWRGQAVGGERLDRDRPELYRGKKLRFEG